MYLGKTLFAQAIDFCREDLPPHRQWMRAPRTRSLSCARTAVRVMAFAQLILRDLRDIEDVLWQLKPASFPRGMRLSSRSLRRWPMLTSRTDWRIYFESLNG